MTYGGSGTPAASGQRRGSRLCKGAVMSTRRPRAIGMSHQRMLCTVACCIVKLAIEAHKTNGHCGSPSGCDDGSVLRSSLAPCTSCTEAKNRAICALRYLGGISNLRIRVPSASCPVGCCRTIQQSNSSNDGLMVAAIIESAFVRRHSAPSTLRRS